MSIPSIRILDDLESLMNRSNYLGVFSPAQMGGYAVYALLQRDKAGEEELIRVKSRQPGV